MDRHAGKRRRLAMITVFVIARSLRRSNPCYDRSQRRRCSTGGSVGVSTRMGDWGIVPRLTDHTTCPSWALHGSPRRQTTPARADNGVCHCEERSDEAIHATSRSDLVCWSIDNPPWCYWTLHGSQCRWTAPARVFLPLRG